MNTTGVYMALKSVESAVEDMVQANQNRCAELEELVLHHVSMANLAASERRIGDMQHHSGQATAYRDCLHMLRDGLVLPTVRYDERFEKAWTVANAIPVACGDNPVLPATRMGCGNLIDDDRKLYRCAECHSPFHYGCLIEHFKTHAADCRERGEGEA